MIGFKNNNKAIDVTFRLYQSRTWYRFVLTKEGIRQIWHVAVSGGAIKSINLKCDKCNKVSCFCPSRFKDFHEAQENYFINKEQYEKRRFQTRKNNHLRAIKKYG